MLGEQRLCYFGNMPRLLYFVLRAEYHERITHIFCHKGLPLTSVLIWRGICSIRYSLDFKYPALIRLQLTLPAYRLANVANKQLQIPILELHGLLEWLWLF